MSASVWSQIDAGTALALGLIVETAAIRKFQRPRVVALTLERLEPRLVGRRRRAICIGLVIAAYEAIVAAGVVGFRGTTGFVFACALFVACAGFLVALTRAVQRSVPCACFGRLGRTAAGGREIGRGLVLVAASAFLVVHRALDVHGGYGFGAGGLIALVATVVLIVAGQRVGVAVRPGVALPAGSATDERSLTSALRSLVGIDNDLYTVDQISGK